MAVVRFVSSELPCFAIIVLAAVSSVLLQGFGFGQATNIYHIPVVLDYFNSVEGPHDAYHQSFENYFASFWLWVSWITTEENIELVFLGIHLIHRVVLLWLIYLIVCELIDRRRQIYVALAVALLPISALIIWRTPVGYSDIFTSHLTHTDVVSSVILLSWLMVLRGRWYFASAALGLAFNFNPFVSFWNVVLIGIVFLRFELSSFGLSPCRRICVMSAIYLIAASPTVLWILQSWPEFSDGAESVDMYGFWRSFFPYHHFVDLQWGNTFKYLMLAAAAFLSLQSLSKKVNTHKALMLMSFFYVILLITLFGAIAPFTPLKNFAFVTFPLRMDAFVIFILFIAAVANLASDMGDELGSIRRISVPYSFFGFVGVLMGNIPLMLVSWGHELLDHISEKRAYIFVAAGFLGLFGLFLLVFHQTPFFNFPGLARHPLIMWSAIVLVSGISLEFYKRGHLDLSFAVLVSGLSVAAGLSAIGQTVYWEPVQELSNAPVGVALMVLAAGLYLAADSYGGHSGVKMLATAMLTLALAVSTIEYLPNISPLLMIILTLLFLAHFVPWPRGFRKRSPSIGQYVALVLLAAVFAIATSQKVLRQEDGIFIGQNENWIGLQRWARANTPPDTMFLQTRDVYEFGFSVHSRRPIWVDNFMGAAIGWQPDYAEEWQARREDISKLKKLPELLAYARSNDVSYLVVGKKFLSKAKEQGLQPVIENNQFAILEIAAD